MSSEENMSDQSQSRHHRPLATYVWLAALSALAAFGAVYVTLAPSDNRSAPQVAGAAPDATETAQSQKTGPNPLSTGAMTTFVFKPQPEPIADVRFLDGNGNEVSLTDFKGKVVLLNVWATWCAPCREEMPALDQLQQQLGSDKFQVLALAVDKSGIEGARKFLDDIKTKSLAVYADPTGRQGTELRVIGMPTTILLNAEGLEIGRLVGPAHWDAPEAKRLIEAQL